MHGSRVLLFILVMFLAGAVLIAYIPLPAFLPMALFIIGAVCMLFSARVIPIPWKHRVPIVLAGLGLIALAAGAARFDTVYRAEHLLGQFSVADSELNPSNKNRIVISVYGYVDEPPQTSARGTVLTLHVISIRSGNGFIPTDERLQVTTMAGSAVYGDTIAVTGTPSVPDGSYGMYLAVRGITAQMNKPEIKPAQIRLSLLQRITINVLRPAFRLKELFETALAHSIPGVEAAFVDGTLFGTRSALPESVNNEFRRTGVSHIVAVSGYNMTIIAAAVVALLILIVPRRGALLGAILCMVIFTYITGASASVVRAAIMGIVVLSAQFLGRLPRSSTAVALAAAIMVAYNPLIIRYDIGFQLSFLSTLGILYIHPLLETHLRWLPAWYSLRETISMTFAAQIMVVPLLMFYFGSLSLVSLPVNIIILPLIPIIMFFGFMTGVAGIFWLSAGRLIGLLTWLPAKFVLTVVHIGASLNSAAVAVQPAWYGVVVLYSVIIAVLMFMYRRPRAEIIL